jgi:hypothetical protein
MRRVFQLALLCAVVPPTVEAQGKFPPDSFTNLKVLPKNIGKQELIATMRGFALGLGVRCTYCHVGREGAPLDSLKFASDDKRTKRAARVMIGMVNHINAEHLADVPDRPDPHVVVNARPVTAAWHGRDSSRTSSRCTWRIRGSRLRRAIIESSGIVTTGAKRTISENFRWWIWRGAKHAQSASITRSVCCSSLRSSFPSPE